MYTPNSKLQWVNGLVLPFTSSIKGYSFANWEEDKELGIIDPVKEPLPKPEMK